MKAAGRGAERIFSVQLRLLRGTSLLRTPLLRAPPRLVGLQGMKSRPVMKPSG
jgi:hypothetical protein